MLYQNIKKAAFLERPNRFIAYANLLETESSGTKVKCHVKNTGRCQELLAPNTEIFLQYHPDAIRAGRKTEYSLISVYKEIGGRRELVNIDSQAPNQAAWEWLSTGGLGRLLTGESPASTPSIEDIRREVTLRDSRFDLSFMQDGVEAFMEVKGVTLEEDGIARFPDAPTERGVKHLKGLAKAAMDGCPAYALFVIAMKGILHFEPNRRTHPAFADALREAASAGVRILAYDCLVTPNSLSLDQPVDIRLT